MKQILVLSALGLMSCSNPGKDAEKSYEIVRSGHDWAAICEQAEAVAAAYLKMGKEAQYKRWKSTSDLDCAVSRLNSLSAGPGIHY